MTDNEKNFEDEKDIFEAEAASEETEDAVDDLTASEESTTEESADMAGDASESTLDVSDESGEDENTKAGKPDHPEAAIEAILFAYGNSVSAERLCETLSITEEELEAAVQEEWGSFELVLSFYNRFVMCKSYCRKNISPFFSGSKTEIPKELIESFGAPPLFNSRDDEIMLKGFHKKGRCWERGCK